MQITLTRLAMVGFQSVHVQPLVLPKASPALGPAAWDKSSKEMQKEHSELQLQVIYMFFVVTGAMRTCLNVESYLSSIIAGEIKYEVMNKTQMTISWKNRFPAAATFPASILLTARCFGCIEVAVRDLQLVSIHPQIRFHILRLDFFLWTWGFSNGVLSHVKNQWITQNKTEHYTDLKPWAKHCRQMSSVNWTMSQLKHEPIIPVSSIYGSTTIHEYLYIDPQWNTIYIYI